MIGDKAYLRTEKILTPNQPIGEALENIRTSVDLDRDFLSYDGDADGCGINQHIMFGFISYVTNWKDVRLQFHSPKSGLVSGAPERRQIKQLTIFH